MLANWLLRSQVVPVSANDFISPSLKEARESPSCWVLLEIEQALEWRWWWLHTRHTPVSLLLLPGCSLALQPQIQGPTTPWEPPGACCQYPPFMDAGTGTQRGSVNLPRPHSWELVQPGFGPKRSGPIPCLACSHLMTLLERRTVWVEERSLTCHVRAARPFPVLG